MPRLVMLGFIACLAVPAIATAQTQAQGDLWRAFAGTLDVGAELTVRLRDGQRFAAALVAVQDDGVLLQPKTRVPVPVQQVPYDAILSLEQRREGMGAGKAAAIGVASGAATFIGILLILLATVD